MMKCSALSCLLAFVVFPAATTVFGTPEPERPNILWITSEDNGPFLGCYGDKFANTPNLDKLASEGILYENAIANAPVCAPARSTIITGLYASSMGTQHMRSQNPVPQKIRFYPQYLREAGYFCSNHKKTDYNIAAVPKRMWDSAKDAYNSREPGQPFFCIFNLGTSHESSLHSSKVVPEYLEADFELPPYHPDTPEIRSNWVNYYKIITKLDKQIGKILEDLEKAGLADDTIVFYYADHGGILPRSKRFLYDTGVHVPMIVRFPEKYQHLAPGKPGTRTDRLVSFVDLAPTVLSLVGIKIPQQMQGEAFLGPQQTKPRQYVYMFRGRMDERYDMMRGVRDGRYKYIRNYLPHRIWGQHLNYLWRMPATRSWQQAYKDGKCNEIQSAFWKTKPTEELFDLKADPWEVNNLADSPKHQEILRRMRAANRRHLLETRDTGFLPEGEMIARAGDDTIYEMVRDPERYPLERIMNAAELAGCRDPRNVDKLIGLMKDDDAAVRFWAATGCAALGKPAAGATDALTSLLKDPSPNVRIAAAEALCTIGRPGEAVPVLAELLNHSNSAVALQAINTLDNIGPQARPVIKAMKAARGKSGYVSRAATHAVSQLENE